MRITFKETKIGRMPEEWGVVRIEDVVAKSSTRNPKKKPLEEFKYVDISSVSNVTYSIREHETMLGKDAPSRAQKEIRAQDILYATVRPYLKRIAVVPNRLDGEICSTGFCVVRCKEQSADHRFVFYILQMDWMTNKLTDLQRGSSYPAITDGDVYGQFIPLPPLPEQREIAEILSTVDETIAKTDAIIQETQQLKKGLVQRLFTEGIGHTRFKETKIGRIPEEWEVKRLTDIFTQITVGFVGTVAPYYCEREDGVLFLRTANVGFGKLLLDEVKYVTPQFHRSNQKSSVANGDILIARVGITGTACIVKGIQGQANCANVIILKGNSSVNPEFLTYAMNSRKVQEQIHSNTAGGVQLVFNTTFAKRLFVPFPSSHEQQRITEILSEVDAKVEKEQVYKAELEQLKKGLMHVLLTGKVRVKV